MDDYVKPYVAALLVLGVLDGLWLGWLMRGFYRRQFGALMLERLRWVPALLFYVGYPAALIALALFPAGQPAGQQVARAALVGLVAYGVYDLTNRAALRHWPLKLAVVKVAWGTFASAAAGAAAVWAMRHTG